MSNAYDIMTSYFSQSKLAGSYFLLFLVSIVLLYYLQKSRNIWFILYGIALLVLVVMNPIVVWALMQLFPALETYEAITLLIPMELYIPFAATELADSMKERKVKHIIVLITVLLICICGNMFGFFKDYSIDQTNIYSREERGIVEFLEKQKPTLVLADEELIPAITEFGEMIPLLYGLDLWTPNMDTGIMDGYNEEAYTFFDALQNSKENATFIGEAAYEYSCDIIVMDLFEEAPKRLGNYKLIGITDNYLIYRLSE